MIFWSDFHYFDVRFTFYEDWLGIEQIFDASS